MDIQKLAVAASRSVTLGKEAGLGDKMVGWGTKLLANSIPRLADPFVHGVMTNPSAMARAAGKYVAPALQGAGKMMQKLPGAGMIAGGAVATPAVLGGIGEIGRSAFGAPGQDMSGYRDQQEANWAKSNPISALGSTAWNAMTHPLHAMGSVLGMGEGSHAGHMTTNPGTYNSATKTWEGGGQSFSPGQAMSQHLGNVHGSVQKLHEYVDSHPIPGMTRDQAMRHFAGQMGLGGLLSPSPAAASGSGSSIGTTGERPHPDLFRYYSY